MFGDFSTAYLYHGSPKRFERFDPRFIGDGTDQYGPGFYLSDSENTAASYTVDDRGNRGCVYYVKFLYQRLLSEDNPVNEDEMQRFVDIYVPDENKEFVAGDYGSIDSCIDYVIGQPNEWEAYHSVWWEFYARPADADGSREFMRDMVNNGISGLKKRISNGTYTYTAYDESKLFIIDRL